MWEKIEQEFRHNQYASVVRLKARRPIVGEPDKPAVIRGRVFVAVVHIYVFDKIFVDFIDELKAELEVLGELMLDSSHKLVQVGTFKFFIVVDIVWVL